ncbi:VWA domain-containing protein [Ornithinimicrobium sediminis]|uniref:VWA domain-containing protein n=1 Tax=Ornithinimicrobium sediminis TaxID=2904603 RepID=UPI001E478CBA|nr:VWA domain-containing protein [Ornithinimicrobium sediminis]MCE0488309.1 VWA domain-containing protein [Ornithinimicrobium sediminis]
MRVLSRLAAAFALVAALVFVVPSGHAQSELSEIGERAFADVAACVSSSETLLVSVVVDQSGSLRTTDPENERVVAVETAVDALTSLRESAGDQLDVQVDLAVFDGSHLPLVQWGSLSDDQPDRLRAAAQQELPTRNAGAYTDYRVALGGAQTSLEGRAAQVDDEACKVILWFTDGRLDVGDATETAQADLCDPQGIADSVRGDQIAVVALALFADEGSTAVSAEDADLLRAVAEGRADQTQCGTTPIPENFASGAYLRATDAGALQRVFAGAGTLLEGGQQAGSTTCPGSECVEGEFAVPVDAGLSGFRLVLDGVDPEIPPTIIAPNGTSQPLGSQSEGFRDASLSVTVREGLTVATVTFDSGGSEGGGWVLDTRATLDSITVVDLYYFWGATLQIAAPDGLVVGESSAVEVSVQFADGTPVDASLYQSLSVILEVDGTPVALSATDDGNLVGEHALPLDEVPSTLDVVARAEAVSSPTGVALGPITAAARVRSVLPPSYATVETAELVLPTIVGEGTSRGVLQLRGSERGESRACVGNVAVEAPELAGDVGVILAEDCITVPAESVVEWPVEIIPAAPADGRIDGTVDLVLSEVDGAGEVTVGVPFEASMVRPINETTRWTLVVMFVAVALAIPLLITLVANLVNGTFMVGPRTVWASSRVRLGPTGVQPQSRPDILTLDDFEGLRLGKTQRRSRLVIGPLTLRRRLPVWLLGEPRFEARHTVDERVLLSNVPPYTAQQGRSAPAQKDLRDVFFLLASPLQDEDGYVEAQLYVVDEDDPNLTGVIDRRRQMLTEFAGWHELHTTLVEMEPGSAGDEAVVPAGNVSATGTEAERGSERPPQSLWDDDASEADEGRPASSGHWDRPTSGRGDSAGRDQKEEPPDRPRSIFDE